MSKNEVFTFDWFKDVNNEENEDDKYAMKLNKEKSNLNEINEKDEINNLDSSKILEENGEHEHEKNEDEKQEEDLNKENLNIEEEKNLINENNQEEEKKEKSSSGSYGLIKSDPVKQNK